MKNGNVGIFPVYYSLKCDVRYCLFSSPIIKNVFLVPIKALDAQMLIHAPPSKKRLTSLEVSPLFAPFFVVCPITCLFLYLAILSDIRH